MPEDEAIPGELPEPDEERRPVDPASFGDPLAERTAWTPLVREGERNRQRELFEPGPGVLAFRAIQLERALLVLLLVTGIAVLGWSVSHRLHEGLASSDNAFHGALAGLALAAWALWKLEQPPSSIVFDKERSFFWKGDIEPSGIDDRSHLESFARLEDIHALQILAKRVRKRDARFDSYELNVVLNDGSRQAVVDHENLPQIREDADTLADFLDCPVWDAVPPEPEPPPLPPVAAWPGSG